jgi:UDP-3-O-[3-hydroxymyristoyl] glucosamine N-acyltransferase
VLYRDVRVGARSVIHSGAVIGADGFGFVWDGSKRLKVPQVGSVRIGDDVEVGANTCIDRATAGETVIEDGVKLDNIVQIGHNVRVGEHSAIAGMSGISGSTKIGKRVLMGGGVGTRDHVTIGDDVALGGRSNVGGDITEPGEYLGTPAAPAREAVRAMLTIHKLPELVSRIRQLEKRLAELEKSKE